MATGECFKCGGSGKIEAFATVANGVCFQCFGLGKIEISATDSRRCVEIESEESKARKVAAIRSGNLSRYSFRQLHAARQFALGMDEFYPGLWDTWQVRGEELWEVAGN